jgi:glucokinase
MKKHTVAIDLGGTNTKLGLLNENMELVTTQTVPTEAKRGLEAALNRWVLVIEGWKNSYSLDAIGIGSPGPLDSTTGFILKTPNLPQWESFSITEFLKTKTGLPAFIENDANCAAYGEYSKNKIDDLVLVTLGTGVGTGVISRGHLVRGVRDLGVEAGHMVIDSNGPLCGCGRRGCLEAFVGGRLFVQRYNDSSKIKIPELEARRVFELAKTGDAIAEKLVATWIQALAIGVGNLVNIFNPSKVILSGGLSAVYHEIKQQFQEILVREAFEPSLKYCEVVVSELQERAGILGAGLWARQQIHSRDERTKTMS